MCIPVQDRADPAFSSNQSFPLHAMHQTKGKHVPQSLLSLRGDDEELFSLLATRAPFSIQRCRCSRGSKRLLCVLREEKAQKPFIAFIKKALRRQPTESDFLFCVSLCLSLSSRNFMPPSGARPPMLKRSACFKVLPMFPRYVFLLFENIRRSN